MEKRSVTLFRVSVHDHAPHPWLQELCRASGTDENGIEERYGQTHIILSTVECD